MAIDLDATAPARPVRPTPLDVTATAAGPGPRAPAGPGPSPGSRLAHFRLERVLGQGAMGQVWLATDLALDRPVAIKLLPPDVAGDPGRRDRMVREARAQARLNHPNVCHIYFIGEDAGQLFFAMEYVAGETLAERMARGPLATEEALALTRMAALGLRAARRAGFTHRDVKPSNLMIDQTGLLKVMDFGLVSASVERSPPPGDGDGDGGVDGDAPAAASAIVGTPLYMAPEQGRGEAVDHRADIYALGATLHHMLAGAPPFGGATAAELLHSHASAVRPPLAAARPRRDVRMVDAVIATMMAKHAADRFADYDQLVDALDRASTTRTRPAGFWVRGTAGFLDLLLAVLLVMPLNVVWPGASNGAWVMAMVTVVATVAIARFGTTPGHALLDLEITRHDRPGRPGAGAALRRELVAYGPMVVGAALDDVGSLLGSAVVSTAGKVLVLTGFIYPIAECARASWRTADKRTLWDRAGGTRVRYRGTAVVVPGAGAS